MNLQKCYTRTIGVFFFLIIISLVTDLTIKGYSAETWHKLFHILLGAIIIGFAWNNSTWWKPFCIANGAFFLFVALFGISFPHFAGLEAFNTTDTVLHAVVGITGLLIGTRKNH